MPDAWWDLDRELNRTAALKIMRDKVALNPKNRERFLLPLVRQRFHRNNFPTSRCHAVMHSALVRISLP